MSGHTEAVSLHLFADASSALLPARNQMALSLGWHIVLSCFGMAFPAMIFVLHRKGLNGDEAALELAKRWSKVAGVLFAIGAVSGTILSFELGLLWPVMMEQFGDVVGLAFALEGIAFFLEAIFLGIYIYGWGRIPGKLHSLMLVPVIASGVAGGFFVISVNAWMNAPTGFDIVDGVVTNVDPIAAMLNSAIWLQFLHMYLAAVMVVGFLLAGTYANGYLKGRTNQLQKLGILVPMTFAAIATPLQPLVGHFAGQRLADEQPIKLAAMEGLAETTTSANIELGGVFIDGELKGAVPVPINGLLSFIAQNNFNAEVIGLNSVPEDERPPTNIVHFAFNVMVGLGMALTGLIAAFGYLKIRGKPLLKSRLLLRALTLSGPAAVVAMETGWITTEVGRQPWIVHGIMRTEDAVTEAGYIWITLSVLIVVYAGMTIGATQVLRSMSKRWAAGEHDLPSAYGPANLEDGDTT